ncbi:MAG: nucleotidyltransferase domain-containing protein [Bacillota bacterium]|nr:MAG: nucleotidyltransferase domain-containing protein [Bacillota bacterium]
MVAAAVFGSVARRTPGPDSDVDLLVVAEPLPDGRIPRVAEFRPVEDELASRLSTMKEQGIRTRLSPVFRTPGGYGRQASYPQSRCRATGLQKCGSPERRRDSHGGDEPPGRGDRCRLGDRGRDTSKSENPGKSAALAVGLKQRVVGDHFGRYRHAGHEPRRDSPEWVPGHQNNRGRCQGAQAQREDVARHDLTGPGQEQGGRHQAAGCLSREEIAVELRREVHVSLDEDHLIGDERPGGQHLQAHQQNHPKHDSIRGRPRAKRLTGRPGHAGRTDFVPGNRGRAGNPPDDVGHGSVLATGRRPTARRPHQPGERAPREVERHRHGHDGRGR